MRDDVLKKAMFRRSIATEKSLLIVIDSFTGRKARTFIYVVGMQRNCHYNWDDS